MEGAAASPRSMTCSSLCRIEDGSTMFEAHAGSAA